MARSYQRIPGFGEWSEPRIITLPNGEQVERVYCASDATHEGVRLLAARDTERGLNLHFAIYHVDVATTKVVGVCKTIMRNNDDVCAALVGQYPAFVPAATVAEVDNDFDSLTF